MVRLAEYSRDCMVALRNDTGIQYDERTQGTLQLFRTQEQLDGIGKDVDILKEYGVPFEVLGRDGYCKVEPALALVKNLLVLCACRAMRPAIATSSRRTWPRWQLRWA